MKLKPNSMSGEASHRYFVRIFYKKNRYFLRRDAQLAKVCMKRNSASV